ncbi:hypothetical protein CNR34_00143 [Pseudomonas phage nickie]|uniref:Uncharacterized protein n=1 Tax=Pseudomonas phage nickie TaxID=2048977 RepID=A0A2H4P7C6_9CAUD|nr:hypothetical protein FDJ16_gp022 [Pseudomonas phage nickie]ATW58076.1 hypothetical protein CNR34_00143 [Pseudomonas phage nickie]
MITTAALSKTVFLVVLACSGDPREGKCGDSFDAESWTGPQAKQECETFLREEFDPSNYLTLVDDEYAAVRCE